MKRNIYIKRLLVGIAALGVVHSQAQDLEFTQSYSMPLQLNPALMSVNNDIKVNAGYRTQWSAIDGGYVTYAGTVLMPAYETKNGKLDGGLSFIHDAEGAFTTMDVSLAVGYTIRVEEHHYISAALLGGYRNSGLNTSSLTFDDQYVAGSYAETNATSEILKQDKQSIIDAGIGAMWYYMPALDSLTAYAGISTYHYYNPILSYIENGEETLQPKFSYIAGVKLQTALGLDVSPNLKAIQQAGSSQFALGLYLDYRIDALSTSASIEDAAVTEGQASVTLGTWYKHQSRAVAFIIGLQYDKYALGYSYDFSNAQLKTSAFDVSTHEVTLSFGLPWAKNGVACPVSRW